MKLIIWLIVIGASLVISVIVGFFALTRCPYCGSRHIRKKKIDPELNHANWTAICLRCGKEFYIE